MKLIEQIEKVNELNLISDDYKISEQKAASKINEIEKEYHFKLTDELKEFIIFVNGKMFYDWVQYIGKESVPVLDGKIGDVGLFYSLVNDSQYDLLSTMKENMDIFEKHDFLFAEASPGDFLVISLDDDDYGKIYFVSHDFSDEEEKRFLVTENMCDFIKTLFIKED